jgi:hypothetical protein
VPHVPLSPTFYPRGTFVAAVGLIVISLYYDHAWRRLKNSHHSVPDYPIAAPTSTSPSHDFIELRYLCWGLAVSIFTFLLAGSADTPSTPLDHLVGTLMGLCGAVFAAMFAVGFVSLWNLWLESIVQLKYLWHSKRLLQSNPNTQGVKTKSLLRGLPVAILWLAAGIVVLIGTGMLVDIVPHWLHGVFRELIWLVITLAFYHLWRGTSQPAMLLRLVLLFVFSVIIVAAAVFAIAWTASETAPLLVTILAAITIRNAAFYARWVRLKALIHNFR